MEVAILKIFNCSVVCDWEKALPTNLVPGKKWIVISVRVVFAESWGKCRETGTQLVRGISVYVDSCTQFEQSANKVYLLLHISGPISISESVFKSFLVDSVIACFVFWVHFGSHQSTLPVLPIGYTDRTTNVQQQIYLVCWYKWLNDYACLDVWEHVLLISFCFISFYSYWYGICFARAWVKLWL